MSVLMAMGTLPNSRKKLTQDHLPKLTEKVTLRCVIGVSAGQKLTAVLTETHAPCPRKTHAFVPFFTGDKREIPGPPTKDQNEGGAS